MTVDEAISIVEKKRGIPIPTSSKAVYAQIIRGLMDAHETATSVCFLMHPLVANHTRRIYDIARETCTHLGFNPKIVEENHSKAAFVKKDVGLT